MTVFSRNLERDLRANLMPAIRSFLHRHWFARNVVIVFALFASGASAEPAHCSIQAYGKTVFDKVCDLEVENNIIKMINRDGSYVSIAIGANNFFLATIHAIHDVAEPKLIPVPLTKDGDCYRSQDGLSRFCAHKLAEGILGKSLAERSTPPQCNLDTTKNQSGICEKWASAIGVNIIQPSPGSAQKTEMYDENYKYIYLNLPQFLNMTGQRYGLVTAGVTDFVITWNDDLKNYFKTHAGYLSRMRMAFSQDDNSIDDKFSKMERAIDAGSKCETLTVIKDNHITYAFVLLEADKVKECFASNMAQALGAKHLSKPENPSDETSILDNLKKIYRQ